jgi:hypothetical protein
MVRYTTREQAQGEVKRLLKGSRVDRIYRIYECGVCGGHHITGHRRQRRGRASR